MENEDYLRGQQEMDKVIAEWPERAQNSYKIVADLIPEFSSFQLLANIIHYNHSHSATEYADYRGDRMFAVAEVVAIIALKSKYFPSASIPISAFFDRLRQVQDATTTFLMLKRAMLVQANGQGPQSTLKRVADKLMEDEIIVRNPGLPEHHELISAELFNPLDADLKKYFGFGIHESIKIRRKIIDFINFRYAKELDKVKEQSAPAITEVIIFRNTGKINPDTIFREEELRYFSALKSKQMKREVENYFTSLIFYSLEKVYVFSSLDLAAFCDLPVDVVSAFLNRFSTGFESVGIDEEVIKGDTILKTTPIVRTENLFIVPSFPLLTWCVEPVFEKYIQSDTKLAKRYKDVKHDFLLEKGINEFKRMLPNAKFYPRNLFYGNKKERICEVDGLIGYDRTLFIIEAKGHRLTQKAKDGNYLRTETHLKQIIRDSSSQGLRTKRFILDSEAFAIFKTAKGEDISISKNQYDEFIIVSLTLEPMGHLIPLMKVVNDLDYFEDQTFPWIVSIYDLIVFADMIELPVLLLHYLKRRRAFLSEENISIYEEIDILAYFLSNGLYIKNTLEDAMEKGVDWMSFDNNTDAINDYYMYKFSKKSKFTAKPRYFLPEFFLELLAAIETSEISHRSEIMLEMLACGTESIGNFLNYIRRMKQQFINDGKIHDCSIMVGSNEIGVTYMVGPDKVELDRMLYEYCCYKFETLKTQTWVGIGDLSDDPNGFDIQCSIIMKAEEPIRYK